MDYFGSLGVCGMFQIAFLFDGVVGVGARDVDGRFEYKGRSQILSTAKGLNKEKRDPTMALLAHPLLLRPADYLHVFLKERIGWIMATAIHFLFFFSFLFLI